MINFCQNMFPDCLPLLVVYYAVVLPSLILFFARINLKANIHFVQHKETDPTTCDVCTTPFNLLSHIKAMFAVNRQSNEKGMCHKSQARKKTVKIQLCCQETIWCHIRVSHKPGSEGDWSEPKAPSSQPANPGPVYQSAKYWIVLPRCSIWWKATI